MTDPREALIDAARRYVALGQVPFTELPRSRDERDELWNKAEVDLEVAVAAYDASREALPRPWCCPDPALCAPILQLRDGESLPLDVPQSGQTFTCFGACAPQAFTYNGVVHENDLHSCHYTALKGVVMYHENRADWENLSTYYHLALRKLDMARVPQGEEKHDG